MSVEQTGKEQIFYKAYYMKREEKMSVYIVANYKITNPEEYQNYPPAAVGTILSHQGEVLVADYESNVLEGQADHVTVVLKFPSQEMAEAWYTSEEYKKISPFRTENTEGNLVMVKQFVMPS